MCRVDDTDAITEVATFEVAEMEVNQVTGEQTLNGLESRTQVAGNVILRHRLSAS